MDHAQFLLRWLNIFKNHKIAEIKLGAQSESRMGLQSVSSSQDTYFHFEVKIFPA